MALNNDATILQLRRGTAAEVANYIGSEGEVIVNTTNKTLHVQDGVSAGGAELALKSDIPSYQENINVFGDIVGNIKLNENSVNFTLPNLGITPGDYTTVTVDEKGRVIGGSVEEVYTKDEIDNLITSVSGEQAGFVTGTIKLDGTSRLKLAKSGVTEGTYNSITVNDQGIVVGATNVAYTPSEGGGSSSLPNSVSLTGDMTGIINFDGSPNVITLKELPGLKAGTYDNGITVNEKGLITYITNSTSATNFDITLDNSNDIVGTINNTGGTTLNLKQQSGITAGWYNNVYVNDKGIVTSASNEVAKVHEQDVEFTGDVTGTITFGDNKNLSVLTLNNQGGLVPGTYNGITVNSKGIVTNAVSQDDIKVTVNGDITGEIPKSGTATLSLTSSCTPGTYNKITVNEKGLVVAGETEEIDFNDLSLDSTGDITGKISFNGSADGNKLTLKNLGVAGTYNTVTVNDKGLVTAGEIKTVQVNDITLNDTGNITGVISFSDSSSKNILNLKNQETLVPGTYNGITVNAKGLVTSATNISDTLNATLSGDVSGTVRFDGTANNITLATQTELTAGTYNGITVNSKGLITSVSNTAGAYTVSGDVTGTISATDSNLTLSNTGVIAGTYNYITVDDKGRVTYGENRSVSLQGDVSGILNTGVATCDIELLDQPNVVAGTYNGITVNSKGLITNISSSGGSGGSDGSGLSGVITVSSDDIEGNISNSGAELRLKEQSSDAFNNTFSASTQRMTINGIVFNKKGIIVDFKEDQKIENMLQVIRLTGDIIGDFSTGTIDNDTKTLNVNTQLPNTGVTAGTYNSVTVDAKGRVTAGSNVAVSGSSEQWQPTVHVGTMGDYRILGDEGITVSITKNKVVVKVPSGKTYRRMMLNLRGSVFVDNTNLEIDFGMKNPEYTGVDLDDDLTFPGGLPTVPAMTFWQATFQPRVIYSITYQEDQTVFISGAVDSEGEGLFMTIDI